MDRGVDPMRRLGALILALVATTGAVAQGDSNGADQLLPADQAFVLQPAQRKGGTLTLQWAIAPGYYLYRTRIHATDADGPNPQPVPLALPPALTERDPLGQSHRSIAVCCTPSLKIPGSHPPHRVRVTLSGLRRCGGVLSATKQRHLGAGGQSMSRPPRVYVVVAVALLLGAAWALVQSRLPHHHHLPANAKPAVAQEEGDPLPAGLHLADLKGVDHPFTQWRGKLLLLNFWATWCAPCRAEIPLLVQAQQQYGARGLQIVGPAVDDPGLVAGALPHLGLDYPVLVGDPDALLKIMNDLGNGPGGLPFSVLVGPNGMIVERRVRAFEKESLDQLIRDHLPG